MSMGTFFEIDYLYTWRQIQREIKDLSKENWSTVFHNDNNKE